MYIALASRPEICFAVSALSRYSPCPLASHFTAAKRATVSQVDSSPPSGECNSEITDYTDSDWANDCADRKSQGGHMFILNNDAISWQYGSKT